MSEARIGISGWRYEPWRGTFYPKGLAHRRELEYASRQFNTIEINGSFYSLQTPKLYRQWYDETPRGFRFAVKCSRFITHLKRLKEIETPLANFFASGVLCLREKLGPMLWQFPPQMTYDRDRFERFLALLPHSTFEAAALAKHHDRRVKGRAFCEPEKNRRIRHAIEVRNETFLIPEFLTLLQKHRCALVGSDGGPKWPYVDQVTSDFVYLRLHGAEELYVSGYDDRALETWARRIRCWMRGGEPIDAKRIRGAKRMERIPRDAYVFFDNDVKVRAPFDALHLASLLGVMKSEIDATTITDGRFRPMKGANIPMARERWPMLQRS